VFPRLRLEVLEDRCTPSAGALDPSFGNDTSDPSILLQPDGKILLGISPGGVGVQVRLNQDGSFDTGFAQNPDGSYGLTGTYPFQFPVIEDTAGGILIFQTLGSLDNSSIFDVTRYNPDGTPDLSFGPNGTGTAHVDDAAISNSGNNGLAVQSDGKILILGTVSTDDG
jgi:hypothetical protein